MKGEIIAIGDELISGRILNSTSALAALTRARLATSAGDRSLSSGTTVLPALRMAK